jgi:hypothetical protein
VFLTPVALLMFQKMQHKSQPIAIDLIGKQPRFYQLFQNFRLSKSPSFYAVFPKASAAVTFFA